MMPELFLADALGATGKPLFRVHTAGSVGGSTAIVASQLVAGRHPRAGAHRRLREAVRESEAMWALSLPIPFTPPLHAGAGGYFAPHIRSYMRRSKAPDHIGILVALKDRLNALKNPYAHLHEPRHHLRLHQGVDDAVGPDPLRRDVPVVRRRLRPGARLARRSADAAAADGRQPAWIQGTAMRSEPTHVGRARHGAARSAARDCAADVYQQAGITDPRKDVDCAEIYVPFCWFEPMWLENLGFAEPGEGWKMTEEGATAARRRPAR